MLGARLLSLIQSHAGPLTGETLEDLITNDRTPSFRQLRSSGTRIAGRPALQQPGEMDWRSQ